MKKILIITSNIQPVPAVNGGATEKLIELLIQENEEDKNYYFEVVSRYDFKASKIAEAYSHTKIHYYYNDINTKSIFSQWNFIITYAFERLLQKTSLTRYQRFISKIATKTKFDYVLVEGGRYEDYTFLKNLGTHLKLIAHVHRNTNVTDLALKNYDHIIAVSEHIKKNVASVVGKDDIDVLLNCCDNENFKNTNLDALNNKDYFSILYIGRLISEKGVIELFDAISSLDNAQIRLKVVGETFYKYSGNSEYSERLVNHSLNQEGLVEFLGYVDNAKVRKIMNDCDLCVVPSQFDEPLSLVPLEAMFAGLPVLLSNAGGLPEWCIDGYPRLARLGETFIDELAAHIANYVHSEEERRNAIQQGILISKEHTSENFYKKFTSLIKKYENTESHI